MVTPCGQPRSAGMRVSGPWEEACAVGASMKTAHGRVAEVEFEPAALEG